MSRRCVYDTSFSFELFLFTWSRARWCKKNFDINFPCYKQFSCKFFLQMSTDPEVQIQSRKRCPSLFIHPVHIYCCVLPIFSLLLYICMTYFFHVELPRLSIAGQIIKYRIFSCEKDLRRWFPTCGSPSVFWGVAMVILSWRFLALIYFNMITIAILY